MSLLLLKTAQEITCGWVQLMVNSFLIKDLAPSTIKGDGGPLLFKKPLLEPMKLGNIYPVSHFPFLGKVLKQMIRMQFQRTLENMDYLHPFSSTVKI